LHTGPSPTVSATDFSIEFQSCSSNIPQYSGTDLNDLFSFEDLDFSTLLNYKTRSHFTLSLRDEAYYDFLNQVFSDGNSSITFSNIYFNLGIFDSITNE